MRSIGDPAFFRVFDSLISLANPISARKKPTWERHGVRWTFERHSFQGIGHSFSTLVATIEAVGRAGWRLLVVREYWWAEDGQDALRELRWARLLGGDRKHVLDWFNRQEAEIDV